MTTILIEKSSKFVPVKYNRCTYTEAVYHPLISCRHIGLAKTTTREALQETISTGRTCPLSGLNSGTWYAHLFLAVDYLI
jgi:hypothetical protein